MYPNIPLAWQRGLHQSLSSQFDLSKIKKVRIRQVGRQKGKEYGSLLTKYQLFSLNIRHHPFFAGVPPCRSLFLISVLMERKELLGKARLRTPDVQCDDCLPNNNKENY